MQRISSHKHSGFSILELSMVMLIIGLLVGGIVIGRDMITVARVRSYISSINKLEVAISAFKTKYNGLPGDFTGATAIWGADTACPATPVNAIPKTATCDGNGDTAIGDIIDGREPFRAIQQLANAGLIAGTYTGTASTVGTYAVKVNVNIPEVSSGVGMELIGGGVRYVGMAFNTTYSAYSHDRSGIILMGREAVYGGNTNLTWPIGAFLTGGVMAALDEKIDDGRPAFGDIQTWSSAWMGCATSVAPSSANYLKTGTLDICSFYKIIQF